MKSEILKKLPRELQIDFIENEMRDNWIESEKEKLQTQIKEILSKESNQGKRTDLETSSKNLEKVHTA